MVPIADGSPFVASPAHPLGQVMVVPITDKAYEYAQDVRRQLRKAGLYCDADLSNNKMQKKVRTEGLQRAGPGS